MLTVTPVVAAGGAAAVEALCPPGKLVITFSFSIQQSWKSLRSYSSCRVDVAQRFPSAAKACKFSSLYRRPQGLLHPVGTQQLRSRAMTSITRDHGDSSLLAARFQARSTLVEI